jgi:hypothetical protein
MLPCWYSNIEKFPIPMIPLPQEFQTIVITIPNWYVQNITPKGQHY